MSKVHQLKLFFESKSETPAPIRTSHHRAVRTPHSAPSSIAKPKATKSHIGRKLLILETLSTERDYTEMLSILCQVYLQPLKKNTLLSKEEVCKIFGNIEMLLNFHIILLSELTERCKNVEDTTCVADILLEKMPFMHFYSAYICGFPQSQRLVEELSSTRPKFKEFLQEARNELRHKNGLKEISEYLIMPVQRVPRYRMLLEKMLQATPCEHPGTRVWSDSNLSDYENLKQAVQKIEELACEVNEKLRDSENRAKVLEIFRKFAPEESDTDAETDIDVQNESEEEDLSGHSDIIAPSRRFVKEGCLMYKDLELVHQNVETELKDLPTILCYVFLFNDLLVLAREQEDGYLTVISNVPLKSIFIQQELLGNAIVLISALKSSEYLIGSEEALSEWVEAIEREIINLSNKNSSIMQWREGVSIWTDDRGVWQACAPTMSVGAVKLSKEQYETQKADLTSKSLAELMTLNPSLLREVPGKRNNRGVVQSVLSVFSPKKITKKSSIFMSPMAEKRFEGKMGTRMEVEKENTVPSNTITERPKKNSRIAEITENLLLTSTTPPSALHKRRKSFGSPALRALEAPIPSITSQTPSQTLSQTPSHTPRQSISHSNSQRRRKSIGTPNTPTSKKNARRESIVVLPDLSHKRSFRTEPRLVPTPSKKRGRVPSESRHRSKRSRRYEVEEVELP